MSSNRIQSTYTLWVLCCVALIGFTGCDKKDGVNQSDSNDTTGTQATDPNDSAKMAPEAENPVLVELDTNRGTILLELNPDLAPITVSNFMQYVKDGFYNGTVFHRVVPGELIQAGRFGKGMENRKEGLREPISSESNNGLANMRGTIAMAHQGLPNSATAEFFINVSDNAGRLDFTPGKHAGYTVFGRIIRGLKVVDSISDGEIGTHPKIGAGQVKCVPAKEVVINKASLRGTDAWALVEKLAEEKRALIEYKLRQNERTETEWINDYIKQTEEIYGLKFEDTDDGLSFMDLARGLGPEPFDGGSVQFAYTGKLLKGLTEFETNVNAPFLTYYELDRLIPGLRMALLSMNVGGKRLAIIPPHLAFGEDGIPRGNNPIPPNATLVYEIELLDIKAPE
ncbi:MAG: peptidylprolyl isomerase [Phycisphaerae bacterium]